MAVQTHLDELINYSSSIINKLANSPEIVGLIVDKADPDMSGEDGEMARQHMFDYDYIDETVLQAGAYIMVDVDMAEASSGTINDMEVYVQICVSKKYMDLDAQKFPGVKGNRRDNLARQVDLLINGSRDLGIGRLQLASARTAGVPQAFTSKMLTYRIPDFAKRRGFGEW